MESDTVKGTVNEKCIYIKSKKWNWTQTERWREKLCSDREIERVGEREKNREIWSLMQTERVGERNGV